MYVHTYMYVSTSYRIQPKTKIVLNRKFLFCFPSFFFPCVFLIKYYTPSAIQHVVQFLPGYFIVTLVVPLKGESFRWDKQIILIFMYEVVKG